MNLLAGLATKFDVGREDLATEALHHILTSSRTASTALPDFVNRQAARVEGELQFTTQATQPDGIRPDLVARDEAADLVLVLEAKFNAGLTGNQPVSYIRNLYPKFGPRTGSD